MSTMNIREQLLKSIHLSQSNRYNIYLVGSRLWGTSNNKSDWDFLIVSQYPSKEQISYHKCQYDIKFLDQKQFIENIQQGSIIEIICYLINKENLIEYSFDIQKIDINLEKINLWLNERQSKDLDKAHKFWIKGNQKSGWKILRHILHSRAIFNYFKENLSNKQISLTIDQIQTIVHPATLLCDQNWIFFDWSDVQALFNEALISLIN